MAEQQYDPFTGMPLPQSGYDGPSPTDAYRMGGLADMAGYSPAPANVWDRVDQPSKALRILGAVGSGLADMARFPVDYSRAKAVQDYGAPVPESMSQQDVERMQAGRTADYAGANWAAGNALGMLGVGAPNAMSGAAGIFGGKLAQTADMQALKQAQSMTKAGERPDVVLDTTGWEKRPDRKWRFEINDRDATFNPQAFENAHRVDPDTLWTYAVQNGRPGVTMSEVMRHPELYAAYPEIADMPVRTFPARNQWGEEVGTLGGYLPDERKFVLRENLSPEQARTVLLHEAQHGVQGIENFAAGGSPSERSVVQRADQRVSSATTAMEARAEQLRDGMWDWIAKNTPQGEVNPKTIKQWRAANPTLAAEQDTIYGTLESPGLMRKTARMDTYRSLLGETEARNVAERADLTPEQRYLLRPEVTEDVPRAEQWVKRQPTKNVPSSMMEARDAIADKITRAAQESAQGITQPELRKLYDDLGLTGAPPSDLAVPSLNAPQPQAARQAAIDLKFADRAALDAMTPAERKAYQRTGNYPGGLLPSQEAQQAGLAEYKPLKKEVGKAEAAFDADVERGIKPSLFDLSPQTLMKTPDVPQYPLPRVAPEQTERLASVSRGGMQRLERAAANAPPENWGWYNLDQARDVFHELHGPARGEQAFQAWLDGVAGTSMVNPIDNNLRSSTWYLQRVLKGEPLPEVLHLKDPTTGQAIKTMAGGPPPGYGAKSQIQHADRVREFMTNTYDPVTNPKPISYRMNLGGNWEPRTVDTHDIRNMVGMPRALELVGGEDAALLPKEYAYLESVGARAAQRAGTAQAPQQAATWVGGGDYTGLKSYPAPLLEALNRRAQVTGKVRGVTAQQALEDAFTGKMPLLSVGGAGALMGGLAAQDRYDNQ